MFLTAHAPLVCSFVLWLEHLLHISLEDHLWVLTLLRLEWLKVLFKFSLWKSSYPFSIFYVFLRFWNFTMMSIYWTSKSFLFSTWTLSGSDGGTHSIWGCLSFFGSERFLAINSLNITFLPFFPLSSLNNKLPITTLQLGSCCHLFYFYLFYIHHSVLLLFLL